jgi:hypothetical protein
MHEDEEEGYRNRDETEDCGEPQPEAMETVAMPNRNFVDYFVFKRSIALGPAHGVERLM